MYELYNAITICVENGIRNQLTSTSLYNNYITLTSLGITKYSSSIYCEPGTVSGTEDTMVNKIYGTGLQAACFSGKDRQKASKLR